MVFCSPIFLFAFLPIVLVLYFVSTHAVRNIVLLAASLFFYAWGEGSLVVLMLASILINYLFARLIDRAQQKGSHGKGILIVAVVANLAVLTYYKYANFIVENLNSLFPLLGFEPISFPHVHLPIGISFITFHSLSYVIDVYRRVSTAQKRLRNSALYISLFPQLVAGPIIRYHDIADQLDDRKVTLDDFAAGVKRFVIGLGKKVIIANTAAKCADAVFALPAGELSTFLAWIGVLAYAVQIYFDFSGYSDMAIGLGRMLGFRFLENFNFPYVAQSVQDFWRRWHISLSNWFRDYLYIPLGGNRVSPFRVYVNLVIVFFLCGLWHGASWTFVVWGLWQGLFLVLERLFLADVLKKYVPRIIRHLYVIVMVCVGWVLFRAETLPRALEFISTMFTWKPMTAIHPIEEFVNTPFAIAMALGIVFSAPLFSWITGRIGALVSAKSKLPDGRIYVDLYHAAVMGYIAVVTALSVMLLASGTYNPFIYFQF